MIVLTPELATAQLAELIKQHPNLRITESSQDLIRLRGSIQIYRNAFNHTLNRAYEIEIQIPLNSQQLPTVIDTQGAIDASFSHRYGNGMLCLETDTVVRLRFIDGFSLIDWMNEYVEPYYFSYDYYCRYGYLPFGERPHNIFGILDAYQEMFGEKEILNVWKLLRYSVSEKYRGHANCPCGSGKKLRSCHGPALFPIMTDQRRKEIGLKDVKLITEELTRYEAARKNPATAK